MVRYERPVVGARSCHVSELQIPDEQLRRQANASLKGYAHQLYLTLEAWIALEPEATLLLEVAEDYARLMESALQMTQAKAEAGRVTLRTESALKAITSLWQFAIENPDLHVELNYLTTATAACEQGASLPGKVGGITYWPAAAAGADVEPLRRLLLGLTLPRELVAFIRSAAPDELRTKLLRRINWICDAADSDAVEARVRDRLVGIAAARGLLASDGERALSALFVKVLKSAAGKVRELRRVDFERAFEAASTLPVSYADARRLVQSGGYGVRQNPQMAPSVNDLYVDRRSLTAETVDTLCGSNRLLLCGMGGAGKTELATAIANHPTVRGLYRDGVLWATLGRDAEVGGHLAAWLTALGTPPPPAADEQALAALWRSSMGRRRMLIVVDDLWEPGDLDLMRPPAGCGLIVTSRSPLPGCIHESLEVGELSATEALEVLSRRAGTIFESGEQCEAETLIATVGRLALALVLAGALLRDGRDVASLTADLHQESLQLAALDLDDGNGRLRSDDSRRTVSLEACLGISVRSLDTELRRVFYRLAVVHDGAIFDGETIRTIIGAPNIVDAARILDRLARRGLLSRVEHTVYRLYRLHDLLLGYARTAFGPSRVRVAPVPGGLPDTLAQLHGELIDRLLTGSPTGRWADVDDAGYFDAYLPWHMEMSGRSELLLALLFEQGDDGEPSWLVRARRNQATSSFLSALRRCEELEAERLRSATSAAERISALGNLAAASCVMATMAAQASQTPIGIQASLVRAHLMTPEEALTNATVAAGGFKAWQMAELLPLVSAETRPDLWSEVLGEAAKGGTFAWLGDSEFLDILLPALNEAEWQDLRQHLSRLPPIVQARFFAAAYAMHKAVIKDDVDRFVTAPVASDRAGWNAGLVLMAAHAIPVRRTNDELTDLLSETGAYSIEARTIFVLASDSDLARLMRGSPLSRIDAVLETFERLDRPLPLMTLVDILGMAEHEPDLGHRALLLSRLCARVGDERPEALFKTTLETLLRLPDTDWRKADGLGHLLRHLTDEQRMRAEQAFVRAGTAIGFGQLGAARLRAITAKLGEHTQRMMLAALDKGSSFDRTTGLAALLEHAAPGLAWLITTAILRESATSGRIGDLSRAAGNIPLELLSMFRDGPRDMPSDSLVSAVRSLVGNDGTIPGKLSRWIEQCWPYLPPDARLKIAVPLGFNTPYASLEDAVRDVASCLLHDGEHVRDRAGAMRVSAAVLARYPYQAAADAVRGLVNPRLNDLNREQLEHVARLSRYFEEADAAPLIERVTGLTDIRTMATALAFIADAYPNYRSALLGHAADRLSAATDVWAAADWAVIARPLLNGAVVEPLLALCRQTRDPRARHALATALYDFLSPSEQEALAAELRSTRSLAPGFVAKLAVEAYPREMRAALGACAAATPSQTIGEALANSVRFDDGPNAHPTKAFADESMALTAGNLLQHGMSTSLSEFYATLEVLAPGLRRTLGAAACQRLAEQVADAAVLYANRGPQAYAEGPIGGANT
ncbi:NB-ARC domain-containing protein [Sphingomonas faeni]|uniref:NB-ARC domain-containing protein n=1 Tax=Sphingomonas faeni TaxID=185950 RepID=UPI003345ACAD